ncbi:hypothetical protein [Acidithrix ferrooxidans]|nr:hypothetical protein [Acidithrix ferrooxidans]
MKSKRHTRSTQGKQGAGAQEDRPRGQDAKWRSTISEVAALP